MPNWCSNNMEVKGEPKELKKFQKATTKGDGSWNWDAWFPTPEALLGTTAPTTVKDNITPAELEKGYLTTAQSEALIKEHGFNNWYDWNHANWGVKWGACESTIEAEETEGELVALHIHFDSPWREPHQVIKKMIKEFPELEFDLEYCEEGLEFEGDLLGMGGKVVYEVCRDLEEATNE